MNFQHLVFTIDFFKWIYCRIGNSVVSCIVQRGEKVKQSLFPCHQYLQTLYFIFSLLNLQAFSNYSLSANVDFLKLFTLSQPFSHLPLIYLSLSLSLSGTFSHSTHEDNLSASFHSSVSSSFHYML